MFRMKKERKQCLAFERVKHNFSQIKRQASVSRALSLCTARIICKFDYLLTISTFNQEKRWYFLTADRNTAFYHQMGCCRVAAAYHRHIFHSQLRSQGF